MRDTILSCTSCSLQGRPAIPGYQYGAANGLVILGEAGGAEEERRGEPFVGQSGELLWQMLSQAGVRDVYLTNTLKHRPPNNAKPATKQVAACVGQFLTSELATAKVIICAGDTAMRVFGIKGGILRGRGKWHKVGPLKVVAMPHPAYILRRRQSAEYDQLIAEWVAILQQAQIRLDGDITLPPAEVWDDFGDNTPMSIDIETDGLDPRVCNIVLIGGVEYPTGRRGVITRLPTNGAFIMHNAMFDAVALARAGLLDLTTTRISDTMAMAHLLGEQDKSLKGLASRRLGKNMVSYEEAAGDPARLASYCVHGDAASTAELFDDLNTDLRANKLSDLFYNIEQPLTPILAHMTAFGGFSIDKSGLARWCEQLEQESEDARSAARTIIGYDINLSSGEQVARYLFQSDEGPHLPIVRLTDSGARGSVDDAAMRDIANLHPLPSILLSYRQAQKGLTTYGKPILDGPDRLSGIWHQCGTVTGRLSSSKRNMQNLPPGLTHFLVAPDGKLIVHVDLSQIELRVAAHMSKDPLMLDVFTKRRDPHAETARAILSLGEDVDPSYNQRQLGKTANFEIVFGGDAEKLVVIAQGYGVALTVTQAKSIIAALQNNYRGFFAWAAMRANDAITQGQSRGLWGRRFLFPRPENQQHAAHLRRCAVNYPIQGGAGDITKQLMIEFTNRFGFVIVNQVHDSIDMVAPESDAADVGRIALDIIRGCNWLDVPLDANVVISKRLSGRD